MVTSGRREKRLSAMQTRQQAHSPERGVVTTSRTDERKPVVHECCTVLV
jgi:hypothetical protein